MGDGGQAAEEVEAVGAQRAPPQAENQDLDGAGDREGEGVVAARADPVAASRLAPRRGEPRPRPS